MTRRTSRSRLSGTRTRIHFSFFSPRRETTRRKRHRRVRRRPFFVASTRDANGVSFSPSVLLDGCHFDGREAVTGTRCASRRNAHVGGCAGDDAYVLPERNMDAAGGTARDPYSWEAFDCDDALEYGEFRSSAEAFYEFA